MKTKIRFTWVDGSVTEREIVVPDKNHLAVQIKFKHQVFKPKKGKGSYNRRKFKNKNFNEV